MINEGEGGKDVDELGIERPIPHILMVLKSKVLKFGQMSVHLFSSPFCNEMYTENLKNETFEFLYSFPPINHISTLLCIGNPDIPSATSFELSMNQSDSEERTFKINSKLP